MGEPTHGHLFFQLAYSIPLCSQRQTNCVVFELTNLRADPLYMR